MTDNGTEQLSGTRQGFSLERETSSTASSGKRSPAATWQGCFTSRSFGSAVRSSDAFRKTMLLSSVRSLMSEKSMRECGDKRRFDNQTEDGEESSYDTLKECGLAGFCEEDAATVRGVDTFDQGIPNP